MVPQLQDRVRLKSSIELAREVQQNLLPTRPPQILLIDIEKKTVRWSSAGHDPAITFNPSTQSFEELVGAGLPLGIDPGQQYQEQGPRSLEEGEIILLGTDGIWEARNLQGERFGKERLRAVIRKNGQASADAIAGEIFNSILEFRNGHPQEDDITLVVIVKGCIKS